MFKISDFVSLTLAHPYQARGYETFFMLNSIEHKIPTAHKNSKMLKNKDFSHVQTLRGGIYNANNLFMSMITFMFSLIKHEYFFITPKPC